jgi:hypothetical protein
LHRNSETNDEEADASCPYRGEKANHEEEKYNLLMREAYHGITQHLSASSCYQ